MVVCAVTVVCLPLTVGDLAYRVWIYGELLCKLGGYLQGVHTDRLCISSAWAAQIQRLHARSSEVEAGQGQ